MVIFTYNDYVDYVTNYKIQKAMKLESKRINTEKLKRKEIKIKSKDKIQRELKNQRKYYEQKKRYKQIQNKKEKQEEIIDKIIDKMLEEKEEIVNIINDYFKMKTCEVTKENIKKCIPQLGIESRIYKIKEKEIYFLIKLEKLPNYHIPYIVLTECMQFIKNWKEETYNFSQNKLKNHSYNTPNNKFNNNLFIDKKNYVLNKEKERRGMPIIIPIIIYIGNKRWNIKESNNIRCTSFGDNNIQLAYNILNFNRYKPIDLIKRKSRIGKLMILKSNINNKTKQKIINMLKNSE